MIILHLSHTDISSDARILKEMISLTQIAPVKKVYGIGIKDINSRTVSLHPSLDVRSILPFFKCLTYPRLLRHLLIYSEVALKMLLGAIRLRPGVIHCHDVTMLPIAVLAKHLTGAKLIYDTHELESLQTGTGGLASKIIFFVEKVSWYSIDALISVNNSIRAWYIHNLGPKRSEVILNSPNQSMSDLTQANGYLREHFGIPKERKIFLYNGLLTEGRGLDLLSEVFQRGDIESHLVFLGYGELMERLQAISMSCSRIHVHSAVPYDRVVQITSGADFGLCLVQNVSLSNYYCLPNKLFEYAFAGLRVLASNLPEIAAVVKKFNLGECVDLEKGEIFRAVKKLESEKVFERIVDSSFVREMSWGAQETKLLSLYRSL